VKFFYDAQIRRYITQMMRIMSNFPVQDGNGNIKEVPVMYGDMSRQVAHVIRENSENKLPSAPRISVYVTGLELDKDRLSDSSYTRKTNIRERAYDSNNNEYLNYQGKNYTVERLMPTPYTLRLTSDIWASNTDQKLQLLEQILVMFNPALEIQTTDNFIDWTSITVVNLDSISWSSRSIPTGVDSEIDVASISFSIPIYISPPIKVKKMGVITNIITSMFDETRGTIEAGVSTPEINQYDSFATAGSASTRYGAVAQTELSDTMANVNYIQWPLYLEAGTAQLITNGTVGTQSWRDLFEAYPGVYSAGVTTIFINNKDNDSTLTGTVSLDSNDEGKLNIDFDIDSFPGDTVIDARTGIDYVIDPTRFNPTSVLSQSARFLILEDIGADTATESAAVWKNADGTKLVAKANDIIEWTGTGWRIVFDASEVTEITYTTNLATGTQYRFKNGEWLKSVDGEYPVGTYRIDLEG